MKKFLIVLAGLLFVGIGIFTMVSGSQKAKRCTVENVGIVVDIVEEVKRDVDGYTKHYYYPVISYEVGQDSVTKKSSTGVSGKPEYSINESVDILYNPDKIDEYVIKGDNTSNLIGIIFICIGSFASIIGLIVKI